MSNPLFNAFGNNNQFGDLIKQAQDFKRQFANINPRAEVERKIYFDMLEKLKKK